MMRPFATFSELILTLSITALFFLASVLVCKMLLFLAKNGEKKLYGILVFSTFLAIFCLYISSLDLFVEFPKVSRILAFDFKLCAAVFCVFCVITFKRLLRVILPKS